MTETKAIEGDEEPERREGVESSIATDVRDVAGEASTEIEAEVTGVPPIPFHFVDKHNNKTTKLLSNSGEDVSIQAKNRWHEYDFVQPLFIAFIDISGLAIEDSDEYEFRVTLEDGKKRKFSKRPSSGKFRIDINEFCTSVAFKPPSIFWSIWRRTPEIHKVSIWGFHKKNLGDFLYKIARVGEIKADAIASINEVRDDTIRRNEALVAKQAELEGIEEKIVAADASLNALNTSVAEKEAVDSELQSKIDRAESQLENVTEQISERRTELQTVTQSREDIKVEINKAKTDLKKLNEDINLFPSEISGFVNQAGNDIRTYTNFVAGLIAIICILFIWVLTGAFDLSEYVKDNPQNPVWPLLLAKLPLAIAVSALVAASYKIARVFIEELLRINRQKLSLTQVSIIAKDVSQAAEHNLGLNEVQTYGLRIRAKMALLSDHIGTFVPSSPDLLLPQNIFDTLRDDGESTVSEKRDSNGNVEDTRPSSAANSEEQMANNEADQTAQE